MQLCGILLRIYLLLTGNFQPDLCCVCEKYFQSQNPSLSFSLSCYQSLPQSHLSPLLQRWISLLQNPPASLSIFLGNGQSIQSGKRQRIFQVLFSVSLMSVQITLVTIFSFPISHMYCYENGFGFGFGFCFVCLFAYFNFYLFISFSIRVFYQHWKYYLFLPNQHYANLLINVYKDFSCELYGGVRKI